MLSETRYEHIILNEAHVPMITGTTMRKWLSLFWTTSLMGGVLKNSISNTPI